MNKESYQHIKKNFSLEVYQELLYKEKELLVNDLEYMDKLIKESKIQIIELQEDEIFLKKLKEYKEIFLEVLEDDNVDDSYENILDYFENQVIDIISNT